MTIDGVSWGAPQWLLPALALLAVALVVVARSYRRLSLRRAARWGAALLKGLALAALLLSLLEPLALGRRVRPGENLFVVLADDSRSLSIRDPGAPRTRADRLREALGSDRPWAVRLAQDFDVRRYAFDARLRAVDDFESLRFDGPRTALAGALGSIARRYRHRPLAGVLLLTDGICADLRRPDLDTRGLPPLYCVLVGEEGVAPNLAVGPVTVRRTRFESAPVTIRAEIRERGFPGRELLARLLDEDGTVVDSATGRADAGGRFTARFELRPPGNELRFYRVRASLASPAGAEPVSAGAAEATLADNARTVAVEGESGPHRVLYVSGRPDWEYKFLRRAIEEDEEVELVALIRIAEREPRFEFRSRRVEPTNPLFRGFEADEEEAEGYDEAVLLRVGTEDAGELRGGFPKTAQALFRYSAVVLDDVEAAFFSPDQLDLLREFVDRRGGGFLMLGGPHSFEGGGYRRTALEEVLPVYLGAPTTPDASGAGYRIELSREGRVRPWVRLREREEAEAERRAAMPPFYALNRPDGIKPGAAVLARAVDRSGRRSPALVVQRFGRGRSAALCVGDLWRWALGRRDPRSNDLARAWRQAVRWLVADGLERVEVEARRDREGEREALRVRVDARDEEFRPLENASVQIEVTGPGGGEPIRLRCEASREEPGRYEVEGPSREPGAYRARVRVRSPDGTALPEKEVGWVSEPQGDELRDLEPDRSALERIARQSGGRVIDLAGLERLVTELPELDAPVRERGVRPLWHTWSLFLFAALSLCGEWAIRRWGGVA